MLLSLGCERSGDAASPDILQHEYSIFAFGTLIDISLFDVDKDLADAAFQQLQKDFDYYHQHWSPWTDGDLAQLNNKLGNKKTITVPEHLIPLITQATVLSRQSDNYFNPAIGKLINLWQFHRYQEEGMRPPDSDQIQSLVNQNPQMSDLTLKHNQLSNRNPAVALNFGAYAKGYAIALEMQKLQAMGIENAVINAGGDLSVIGQHGKRLWNIGIRHPREEGVLASIEAQHGESVFTSGDYERYFYFQGKRYHHILNPKTGYPGDGAQSVTVVHDDAAIADAAATAIFVAGSNNWLPIAKNMGVKLVMLVSADGDIEITDAMKKRLHFNPKFLPEKADKPQQDNFPVIHIFDTEQL